MKGLAISSSSWLRGVHNSVARYVIIIIGPWWSDAKRYNRACDLRLALHNLSQGVTKPKSSSGSKGRPAKKRKTSEKTEEAAPEYHYVGYVHCHNHVWEIDGLSNGPIDLGRTDTADSDRWIDILVQALTLRMNPASSNGTEGGITFNVLAVVDSKYTVACDEYQLLKRERKALERRMGELIGNGGRWEDRVRLSTASRVITINWLIPQQRLTQRFWRNRGEPRFPRLKKKGGCSLQALRRGIWRQHGGF